MRKTAFVFLVSVFAPTLLLGVLALHTASEQRVIIEYQTFRLYHQTTDELAASARRLVEEQQRAFTDAVSALLTQEDPRILAGDFHSRLVSRWPRASVGFAVTLQGELLSPSEVQAQSEPTGQTFLASHRAFLSNQIISEIYQAPAEIAKGPAAVQSKLSKISKTQARNVDTLGWVSKKAAGKFPSQTTSQLNQWSGDFQTVVSLSPSGTIARFAQDRLELLFWFRPARTPDIVFGAMLSPDALRDLWQPLLASSPGTDPEVCVAILNERAEPVARSDARFNTDWKRPFAATEIGEVLPHWEAALYLIDPRQLVKTARLASLTLMLLIVLAFGAIAWGGYLVAVDTRRQLALAQKKTDFVSNVSHELKSPLTSIRMFAELLQQDRVTDPSKRSQYLRLIMLEAERLTRLINNVLDFAKLERNQKPLDKQLIDLYPVIQQTWESQEMHLRAQGFRTAWEAAQGPYHVIGDADALSQILVNLLSNAEKYSPHAKDVTLRTSLDNGHLCVSVLDRGLGIPPGEEERIFEPFHRAHDSLASGIQGSGLGLTLAQRLAAEHGGSITYEPRQDGGSCFTVRLPMAPPGPAR